jgi:hypothetical protein
VAADPELVNAIITARVLAGGGLMMAAEQLEPTSATDWLALSWSQAWHVSPMPSPGCSPHPESPSASSKPSS